MTAGELGRDSGPMGLGAIVFAAPAILVFVMVRMARGRPPPPLY